MVGFEFSLLKKKTETLEIKAKLYRQIFKKVKGLFGCRGTNSAFVISRVYSRIRLRL